MVVLYRMVREGFSLTAESKAKGQKPLVRACMVKEKRGTSVSRHSNKSTVVEDEVREILQGHG